ncbi:class I SAM-dependent methyltransferase [Streptosporangium sp. NPDC051023]|uniref:class I SAM-dependent methyltransferase n=1 Tax=Streptosporangium sp. NPDC051023 TaxID=3155410 RepID=UPI00344C3B64
MAQTAGRRTPFDEVYDQPDPRAFFGSLGRLGYQTPHHAQPVFRRLAAAQARSGPVTVADLCCSYGISAALLNHHLTFEDLYARYTSPQILGLTTIELIRRDRDFYTAYRRENAVPVVGLDIAAAAIDYALAVGLLDAGFAENLETGAASAGLLRAVRPVSLITVTGGVSFLTARTFRQLLRAAAQPVWVAAFVLRTGSYKPIADALAEHGLITEVNPERTTEQRRFTDPDEQRYAVAAVRAAGADPTGKETAGSYHTAVHLSRPPQDLAMPYASLIADADPVREVG